MSEVSTMKKTNGIPRYQEIAADLASKIVSGSLIEGQKISARSDVATLYGVSSETARRAILVLEDLKIVEVNKGSGVVITSYDHALSFVRNFEDIHTSAQLKDELVQSIERQKKELSEVNRLMTKLLNRSSRLQSLNPFTPFQVEITKECQYLNKSLGDLNFWHQTSATIVGYRRNGVLQLSCGPYATLDEGDIYYFIGDEACIERVLSFLYQ